IVGGGEPFLITEQINFLKECVAQGISKQLSIRFHTNGTALNDDILALLSNFRQIDLMVSIDGLDEQNHYVRYPAKWSVLLNNLEKLDNTPSNIRVYMLNTLHAMNIYYFPDFLKWFMSKGFKKISVSRDTSNLPYTGIAHTPYYLNPRVLPENVKSSVRKRFELLYQNDFPEFFKSDIELLDKAKVRFNANLDYMDAENRSHEFAQFKSYIKTLDKTRQTNFKEVFPELYQELGLA
ncbi:MAG: twitch domain-containing radical SAM protein, partial [Pseudobdellovibrio sp.]